MRLHSCQPIHLAVVHAERCRNQNGVVDFNVGLAQAARLLHIFSRYQLAITLHFACDNEQRLQLPRYVGVLKVGLGAAHQFLVAVQMSRRNGAMDRLAEMTIVQIRDIGSDQFALPGRETVRGAQENLNKIIQRPGSFRTKRHRASNSGLVFGQSDVWRGFFNLHEIPVSLPASGPMTPPSNGGHR